MCAPYALVSKLVFGTYTGNPGSSSSHSMNLKRQRQSGSYLIWRVRANKTQREGWLTCSLEDGESDDKNPKRGAAHQ